MIEITTKKGSLNLDSNAKITVKKKSSLFTNLDKEGKQSYSFPFILPITALNNNLLSNNLLEQKADSFSVTTKKNGVRLFKADMRITKRTNENYEVALQLNQKVDLFNRKMNTLYKELGTFFITDSNHFVDFAALPYTQLFVAVFPNPANIPQKWVISGITYEFLIINPNSYAQEVADVINADPANNALVTVRSFNQIRIERNNSSLPFSAYSVEKESTYNIFWFPFPENRNNSRDIAVQHANTIDAIADFRDSEYCFPYFQTVQLGQANTIMSINKHNSTAYIRSENNITLPSLRVTAIIEKILNVEGWKLESTFLKNLEIEKLFLLNAHGIAFKESSMWGSIQQLQVFYADCLNDLSLSEFVKEIQTIFCLNVDFDHTRKILSIEPLNTYLSNKLAKEYKCTLNFSEKTKDKVQGYILKYTIPDYKEGVESYALAEKVVQNGSIPIVSNLPFLPNADFSGTKLKFFDGGLNINKTLSIFNKESLKYLPDRYWLKEGQCKSVNFMDYVTREANFFTENYSLNWGRLYEDFYRDYLSLLDNSEVERELICTFSEMQSFNFLQRIRAEYSNYYIKELEYTLLNTEQLLILVKVILIKTI